MLHGVERLVRFLRPFHGPPTALGNRIMTNHIHIELWMV